MKKESKNQLKWIFIQALQEYFEQSGVNQILKTLYQNAQNPVVSQSTKRVKSILQSNPKKDSKTSQLKQKYAGQLLSSQDDYQMQNLQNIGVQGVRLTPNIKAKVNQNIDPLENGGSSILDNLNELPNFLTRGLSKIKNNGN